MSRSACLIFNPVAGQGNSEEDLALICSILQPEITLHICLTTPEINADILARQAVKDGAQAVIVCGGDGTISAATAAIAGTQVPLGIISRGTANAFANALDLPLTIDAACETILTGATRMVDTATCNGLPMVLLAGIGFEAETVELADRDSKNRLGLLAYVLAGVEQLRSLKHFEVEIETEDRIIEVTASAVTIANAAPATSILAQGPAGVIFNDGLLDLTIVSPINKLGAIAASYDLLTSAFRGDAVEREDVGYLRAKWFRVRTNPPQKVVLDGEIIGDTPIDVRCLSGTLKVFSPQVEAIQPIEKLEGLPNLTVTLKP
jgi:YegS/Rv2252/BmrU family lipid kinase